MLFTTCSYSRVLYVCIFLLQIHDSATLDARYVHSPITNTRYTSRISNLRNAISKSGAVATNHRMTTRIRPTNPHIGSTSTRSRFTSRRVPGNSNAAQNENSSFSSRRTAIQKTVQAEELSSVKSTTQASQAPEPEVRATPQMCRAGSVKFMDPDRYGSNRLMLCCGKMCGGKCGSCMVPQGLKRECCKSDILAGGKECRPDSPPPCFLSSSSSSEAFNDLGEVARERSAQLQAEREEQALIASQSNIAFVVFYTEPDGKLPAEYKKSVAEKKTSTPQWAKFDAQRSKMDKMIKLNFESARLTHPGCRLVILTDSFTSFDLQALNPGLQGPQPEIVRTNDLDHKEEMISRLRSRVNFLDAELDRDGTHNLIFLDTDMLVTRSLNKVFEEEEPYDVALTWRQESKMPINGGILFVRRDRLQEAQAFFKHMLSMTEDFVGTTATRRWFGQSDQVALASIMTAEHGYEGPLPGTPLARHKMSTKASLRTTYTIQGGANSYARLRKYVPGQRGEARQTPSSFNLLLLPCSAFNGSGQKLKDRKGSNSCMDNKCCCSEDSAIIHFKGKLKENMLTYWKDACPRNNAAYKCATIPEKCQQLKY